MFSTNALVAIIWTGQMQVCGGEAILKEPLMVTSFETNPGPAEVMCGSKLLAVI
jgi:hypothetical protein